MFVNVYGQVPQHAGVLPAGSLQVGKGERWESATEVRLDGDEMAADADDGDAGDVSKTCMAICSTSAEVGDIIE